MRCLPSLAFILTGLVLAGCNLMQPVRSPPRDQKSTNGIPVGQAAPDIVGEDLEGKPLKLSNYCGKVVAVVFWGTWCPPCRAMLPHERELVARMEGKPFVLLGVNCDGNRETARQFAAAKNLSWRMFWDGNDRGPIVRQYQVQVWPAIFVLDAQGVIRYRDVRGADLEQAVETLLREVPEGKR